MTKRQLIDMLFDPHFDVSVGGWRIIEYVKAAVVGFDTCASSVMICQLLLRLRADSPWVFAITAGQFPGYENIEEMWKRNGYVDGHGHLWVVPKIET